MKQREARFDLLKRLCEGALCESYGIEIEADDKLCEDPGGDELDALLCAIQAAWAWQNRVRGYGAKSPVDSLALEGWIASPVFQKD